MAKTGKTQAREGKESADEARARRASFKQQLDKTVIAIPLLEELKNSSDREPHWVIIDANLMYGQPVPAAEDRIYRLVDQVTSQANAQRKRHGSEGRDWGIDKVKSDLTPQYIFARLTRSQILRLVRLDNEDKGPQGREPTGAIYKIWPDFEVEAQLNRSVATIKADAARVAFSAAGQYITWAVIDSGIDGQHPHFKLHRNLELKAPMRHLDLTGDEARYLDEPEDPYGHGTHVAGIIAGEIPESLDARCSVDVPEEVHGVFRHLEDAKDPRSDVLYKRVSLDSIGGVAPKTRLVSLRALNDTGGGRVSNLIAAIGYVQQVNDHGRLLKIHGVNLSVGYEFDPEWFACGHSPLCVEVDRLVRSGVVVVTSAGNTGYGARQAQARRGTQGGLALTINDPGNADLAITVGATHGSNPHQYGVSYFSSKGPTGDGRLKPDLVAPGEKILSCAAGALANEIGRKRSMQDKPFAYREDSGTSMAAPHVAGAIAAFLSIRREFIGHPQRIKEIFLETATDLRRERYFQGAGLLDLMRAIQSV